MTIKIISTLTLFNRIRPIYEKLSDQLPDWAKFRYTPKGQLGEILANLGENCNGAKWRNFTK